jgi:GT2 family glycosyltransferase
VPSAVLAVDLENLPDDITGLSAYGKASVLIKLRGRPVAQVNVPVADGVIRRSELRDAVVKAAGWPLRRLWIADFVGWDDLADRPGPPPATVAICTRDRTDDLRRCLEALGRLSVRPAEIVVIDNCPSTDATRRLVESVPSVRYVLEPRPGLDVARNRAIREATEDIVAFVDDDAMPDPRWLESLVRNFAHPLVGCVTGLTVAFELDTDAQETHERWSSFSRGFDRKVFDSATFNPAAAGQIGAGVNMAIRRSVVAEVGEFDEALDAGTGTRSGGDTEMFARVLLHGYRVVYEPTALSWHRHRRDWNELRRMVYGYGVGVYAWWTSFALSQRYPWMVRPALHWFFGTQLPAFVRTARQWHRNAPLDLIVREIAGCFVGPWAYLSARRRRRRETR